MNGSYNFNPMTGEPIGQAPVNIPEAAPTAQTPQGQPAPQTQDGYVYPQTQYPQSSPTDGQGGYAYVPPAAPSAAQGAYPYAPPSAAQGSYQYAPPAAPSYTQGTYPYAPAYAQPAPPAPVRVRREKPKREFTTKEKVLAWIAALVGYLFCRTFWVWEKPFTALIFTFCLFAFAFVFFGKKKRKARSIFYPVSALILSSSLFFSISPALLFFVFSYICVAFLLYCQTGSETALEDRAGQLYVMETVKALFVSPFKSIGSAFQAIGSNKGGKKIGKTLLIILAGIGIAFIPTVIVTGLLSYDSNFTDILEKIWETIFDKLFTHVWSLIFGVPIGMYVYASLYTSAHPVPDGFNAENCVNAENKMKFAPPLVGAVAIAPLFFLYFVFIAAQRDYYKAILTSTLPDAYTFAEFARDGFFRLCVVAAINAIALILLRVFSKKTKAGKISPVVKTYTVILSLVTIVISGTAISQMIMYVSTYGLTRMRLYALWFMALLVLLFIVTILKQFIEKLPFASTALVICVLCFGLLAVPDSDAFIARHNYNCAIEGSTHELDVNYLAEHTPSSVPVLCEIVENGDLSDYTRNTALGAIGGFADQNDHTFNLPTILAERAYNALDRETQLRAAVYCSAYCPPVYLSEDDRSFTCDDGYCDLKVYTYDKNDAEIFTDSTEYKLLTSGDEYDAAVKMIRKYADVAETAGRENELPFTENDLSSQGRFYIIVDGFYNYSDYYGVTYGSSDLYLYDAESGVLTILHLSIY